MKKVVIATKLDPIAREILQGHGAYHVVQDETTPLTQLAQTHADAYALIVRSEKVPAQAIDAFPALKVIIRAGAGYNTIDTQHARRRSIDVMNTPGANANAVAEEVVALMLADARHLVAADASARSGKWEKKRFMGREISGKTVGIIGLGAIGKRVAKRLSGFDVTLLGYDPVMSEERARELDIELVEQNELFRRADYITLHVPENDETRGMINGESIRLMKEGVTIVNCARAGVVNESDLRALKAEKKIRFLNDVYPADQEGEKSVSDIADLMMPHLGASTMEANFAAARRAAEQLIEFDERGITSCIVNRDIPPGLDAAYAELANVLARICRHVLGTEAKLKVVETSFYGTLKPYAQWLLVPIVAGLNDDFDRAMDFQAAQKFLHDMGIDYADRDTDDHKGYKSSITVDLIGSLAADSLVRASVRGTVTEGNLMVARVNAYDKLYFEPLGHNVLFTYRDRPGVLGRISSALADAGVNIDDVRNPHDDSGETSLALLKVNQPVPPDVIRRIARDIEAKTAFYAHI